MADRSSSTTAQHPSLLSYPSVANNSSSSAAKSSQHQPSLTSSPYTCSNGNGKTFSAANTKATPGKSPIYQQSSERGSQLSLSNQSLNSDKKDGHGFTTGASYEQLSRSSSDIDMNRSTIATPPPPTPPQTLCIQNNINNLDKSSALPPPLPATPTNTNNSTNSNAKVSSHEPAGARHDGGVGSRNTSHVKSSFSTGDSSLSAGPIRSAKTANEQNYSDLRHSYNGGECSDVASSYKTMSRLVNGSSSSLAKSASETRLDLVTDRDGISSDGTGSNTNNNVLTPNLKHSVSVKHSKKESLRQQKKFYRQEKKKFAQEIMSTLADPSIEMISNFLKVRTNLKSWSRFYCVLKPGLLVLYKSQKTYKNRQWVGTVLLSACQLIERPSKKDGFCFKLFHPLEQSIWALKGPHGESTSLIGLNLPSSYLIFRALSDSDGKCWMDHLELTMKISPSRLKCSINDTSFNDSHHLTTSPIGDHDHDEDEELLVDPEVIEKIHFPPEVTDGVFPHDLELDHHEEDINENESENDDDASHCRTQLDSSPTLDSQSTPNTPADCVNRMDFSAAAAAAAATADFAPVETKYVPAPPEVMGDVEGGGQEEAVHGENKSLILTLVKQVKPGMDLSKVVLPTFILEPRSFLDKLSDYYYHCDMIPSAISEDDPFERMKTVVIFYLSGFYKKPKGLKKPYNPILGEYFRCYWQHPSGSKTFYIAEQVSHHPPVSTFHVSNRAEGFAISGTILAKSRFYGTSISALFDGCAKLTLLTRGEDYEMTFPYAFCKGILFGTLSMELGGKVHITCEKTGYHTDIEFKLKPYLFAGKDSTNAVIGHISLGGKKLATFDGKWDGDIFLTDLRSSLPQKTKIWSVNAEARNRRLPRYIVEYSSQNSFESDKLWSKVEKAINSGDQKLATEEKFVLEERQRKEAKERLLTGEVWRTKFFNVDPVDSRCYVYKYLDYRPWDKDNDLKQYEIDGVICTLTKHKIAPLMRSTNRGHGVSKSSRFMLDSSGKLSLDAPLEADIEQETSTDERWLNNSVSENDAVTSDLGISALTKKLSANQQRSLSRSSNVAGRSPINSTVNSAVDSSPTMAIAMTRQLSELIDENTKLLRVLRTELANHRNERNRAYKFSSFIITVAIALLVQIIYQYFPLR